MSISLHYNCKMQQIWCLDPCMILSENFLFCKEPRTRTTYISDIIHNIPSIVRFVHFHKYGTNLWRNQDITKICLVWVVHVAMQGDVREKAQAMCDLLCVALVTTLFHTLIFPYSQRTSCLLQYIGNTYNTQRNAKNTSKWFLTAVKHSCLQKETERFIKIM